MSKKESYWFSHDSNAANSPQLVALRRKYGYEGYGRWWRLLERLRECEDYRYDIGTPFAWDVLGQDLDMDGTQAEAYVRDCVEYFQLLQCDEKHFWSDNLLERMEYWEKRREVLRERGRKGGKARMGKKNHETDSEEEEGRTGEAQASNSLSTSEAQVNNSLCTITQNEANETKQNQTKRNETMLYKREGYDNNDVDDIMDNKGFFVEDDNTELTGFDLLRNKALADDQRFVFPYVSTGKVNKEQLGDWLAAFNKWLEFSGEVLKEERDYRRHFAAWFRYRDTVKEDPKQYNPVGPAAQTAPAASKTVPLPVAKTIVKETPPKEAGEKSSFKLALETDASGKYSKGDNKYDMYWLKNLRDEMRSMGESG